MLTGRESLLRVIGKRRRFLPNRQSILSGASSSTFGSFLSLRQSDEIAQRDSVEHRSDGDVDPAESVNCPVCGDRFIGLDNVLINSHLDDCLAKGSKRTPINDLTVPDICIGKGSKRKLSQVTLLQLNFSRSKVKLGQSSDDPIIPSEPDRINTLDTIHNLNGADRSGEYANDHFFPVSNDSFVCHLENLVSEDAADFKFASPPLPSGIEGPKDIPEELLDDYDVSEVIIPTFIVGRRFGCREQLDPESRIYLSRDPGNVKDPNAIKVLSVDCGNDNMLGYIPRELAQYLSPLINKFCLNFEGSIPNADHMLTGRESLLRVIGKRRRFLPNRQSILSGASASSSTFGSFLSLRQSDEIAQRDSVEHRSDGDVDPVESVNCPVCGDRFIGLDNVLINSHLDDCLAKGSKRTPINDLTVPDICIGKGSKRKLSQVTLLQLNFSRSKVKLGQSSDDPVIPSEPDRINTLDTIHNLNGLDRSGEYANDHFFPVSNDSFVCHLENLVSEDADDFKFASPPLPSGIEGPKDIPEELLDDCDVSEVIIPTFIVGRRFVCREELDPESRIYLSRDPGNVKDPNAIKVLSVDCGNDNMLGYIPRELAQYLSPLINKFCLNFEGSITSLPQDSRASVPIQIVCRNVGLCDLTNCDNIQEFKSLWKQALGVVEHAKTNPSGTTRYHRNMVLLIQEAIQSNRHLFTDNEMSFLEAFNSLPDDSRRLFARLYTRKGPWFRMSSISYPEIADCDQAIKGLLEAGYLFSFPLRSELEDNDLEEVLNILYIDELREALRVLRKKCNHGTRKQDMIELLLSSSKDGPCSDLRGFVLAITGSCVKVSPLAELLVWRAERLFFLNGEQDLSAFLLVDLGIVKYPAYRCIISEQIFENRSDLLSYEEAIELSQIMVEYLDENNSELVSRCIEMAASRMSTSLGEDRSPSVGSMAAFLSQFTASWVYSKVVLLGVSFLEREKRYIEAINLLKQLLNTFISDRRRGYWTLRLSVDLEHLGRVDDSLQIAEDGLLDPWVRAGSRVALQKRVLRLGKPPRRWKIPSFSKSVNRKIFQVNVQGRPLNCKTGMKSVFYGEDGERCGVEELALQYYAGEGGGWQGVHSESGIWLTIFGILMWDIIFADVPNVFRTNFQTAPLDLETDTFYETRKALIESHLDKIQDGMAEEILITNYESHMGTACRGVNWEKHPLSNLRAAVNCIGGPCLASICRHLAQDYRSWSSGMPDLLLWRLHDCYRGEAKLVEVKGPRDRLSEQQRAWLLVLMDCGFNVEVCKVTPAPVAT